MNDTSTISPELTAGSASPSANSAGQLLRQYRESTGLHIVALSSALKVARSKLEALEGDRLKVRLGELDRQDVCLGGFLGRARVQA